MEMLNHWKQKVRIQSVAKKKKKSNITITVPCYSLDSGQRSSILITQYEHSSPLSLCLNLTPSHTQPPLSVPSAPTDIFTWSSGLHTWQVLSLEPNDLLIMKTLVCKM